ncbi:MAG: sialate O-acetylesterase, partial [Verrucomicrobiota bacterium]
MRSALPCAVLLLVIPLVCSGQSEPPLTLHPLFSDLAVLQCEKPLPIWGKAAPDSTVDVLLGTGAQATTRAAKDGSWMVTLSAQRPSQDPTFLRVSSDGVTLLREGLLLGEVWLCTGQSNMAWALRNSEMANQVLEEVNAGSLTSLRLFAVEATGTDLAKSEPTGGPWTEATEATLPSFSATGTYFARFLLQQKPDRPVGLIKACSGGTNVYSWITPETFETHPAASVARRWWPGEKAKGIAALAKWKAEIADYHEKRRALIKAKDQKGLAALGRAPREPLHARHFKRPTALYQGTIAPLQPYAVRGAIWYQGEANSRAPWAPGYAAFLDSMVAGWQAAWSKKAGTAAADRFDFYAVQLPAFAGGDAHGWPLIREQFATFAAGRPEADIAVTIDSGEAKDIHPRDKHIPGERLARIALAKTYGHDIPAVGPVWNSLEQHGEVLRLTFDVANGSLEKSDRFPIRHFEIAGENGVYQP